MILMIDNYDSFTYNLVQYLGEIGADVVVRRNDAVSLSEAAAMQPSHLVISPGPGDPDDAGVSLELIRGLSGIVPILGVCLGHQCLASAFGGEVLAAHTLMHGKTSAVRHDSSGVLAGLPSPLTATRYHSLAVSPRLPPALEATAWADDGEVMALRHRSHPSFGLQFHPESILTEHGHDILRNFLRYQGTAGRTAAADSATCRTGCPNGDYQ